MKLPLQIGGLKFPRASLKLNSKIHWRVSIFALPFAFYGRFGILP
jgi:hypothetical protein